MTTTPNPDLLKHVQLLILLHELIRAGQGDCSEADAIRDQLDTYWIRLNQREKELVRGLSSDLHTLGRLILSDEYDDVFVQEVGQAIVEEKWLEAISLLRTNDSNLSPIMGSYFRGLYWAAVKLFNAAILFFQDATRLNPAYEVFVLTAHVQAGRAAAVAPRAQEIVSQRNDWVLVLAAAEVLFVWADELPPQAAAPIHRQAIAAARRGLALQGSSAFAADSSDERWKFHRVNTNLNLALSCEQLGETSDALQACEDALRIDPNDFNALMLYGWLRYPEYPTTERGVFRGRMRQNLIPNRLETHVAMGKA